MIPTKTGASVSTDFADSGAIAMTIDQNALAHIMSVLTDLYSDPEQAIIREYACNARDSHIEAGQTRPIEISTPGPFSNLFVVQDYGIGLSVDEISDIYSKYGSSTKRGTDEQTGMLGLGGKSALTYAPQFTVTSVKHGVKAIVSVSKTAEGSGVMNIVDTVSTNEPDGVRIEIPTPNRNTLDEKVRAFFALWPAGSVLVNGAEPRRIEGIWLDDTTLLTSEVDKDMIVMGGVPYSTEGADSSRWSYGAFSSPYNLRIVKFAPIGTVNFTPSRENLHFTRMTKEYVAFVQADVKRLVEKYCHDILDACTTKPEAFAAATIIRTKIDHRTDLEFQGEKIPAHFSFSHFYYTPQCYGKRKVANYTSQNASVLAACLIVTGTTVESISPGMRQRADLHIENIGLSSQDTIFVNAVPGAGWVDLAHTITYEDLKKVKLATTRTVRKQAKAKTEAYEVLSGGDLHPTSVINGPVAYLSPAEVHDAKCLSIVESLLPDHAVVVLGKNRWDKFLRDFPNAIHAMRQIEESVDNQRNALSERAEIVYNVDRYNREVGEVLVGQQEIDDPKVWTLVDALSDPVAVTTVADMVKVESQVRYLCQTLGYKRVNDLRSHNRPKSGTVDWFDNYPLISRYAPVDYQAADTALYINSKFATNRKVTS